VQEYAIVIAASSSLLEGVTLADYHSYEFPSITFKAEAVGQICIINGHHRIAAWKQVHQSLLLQLTGLQKLLQDFKVFSDYDSPEIIEARSNMNKLKQQLYVEGGWGAIVLDYGKL